MKKYLTLGCLIPVYIKCKTTGSQKEKYNKFMVVIFNHMIKRENEVLWKLEEGTNIFGTRNGVK